MVGILCTFDILSCMFYTFYSPHSQTDIHINYKSLVVSKYNIASKLGLHVITFIVINCYKLWVNLRLKIIVFDKSIQ